MVAHLSFEIALIDAIRPFAKNPKKHPKRQIDLLAKAIDEIGFVNPALVDEESELIAGHGRLLAAQNLGLKSIPIIRISGLTSAQKRGLRIADNKLAERSVWDIQLLTEELELLVLEEDYDVSLTGIDEIEIEKLLTDDADDPDDEPPIAPPPVTSSGWCSSASPTAALCDRNNPDGKKTHEHRRRTRQLCVPTGDRQLGGVLWPADAANAQRKASPPR